MPIAVKDYSWSETKAEVEVTLPLKGVKPSKVDVLSTNSYLKVSYPPFLFEAHLHAAVKDEDSRAQIGNGVAHFVLKKAEPAIWGCLCKATETDGKSQEAGGEKVLAKAEVQQLREQALSEAERRAKEADRLRQERKQDEKREAVKQQIDADDLEKKHRAAARQAAIDEAMVGLEDWQKSTSESASTSDGAASDRQPVAGLEQATRSKAKKTGKSDGQKGKKLPAVRQSGTITVSFTPRVLPTPMRESKVEQEEEWLSKQREAAKFQKDFETDNPDFAEKDPLWLKDKGNAFYRQGNFESAINAYSFAIRRGGTLPALFSNRAACNLQLQNYDRCVKDCCLALDLLDPPVEDNRKSRVKVLVRRGMALVKLDMLPEALKDYQEALKLEPGNAEIAQDEKKLRDTIQGSSCK